MRRGAASGRFGAGSRVPDAAQRGALAERCAAEPGPACLLNRGPGSAQRHEECRSASATRGSPEAQQLEQRLQVAELLAGGGRGAADEVEDFAVLQAVIGQSYHLA